MNFKIFMKAKSLLSLLLYVALPFLSGAQNTFFSANFEKEFNLEWLDFSSGMPNFERTTASKYEGDYGFHMKFNDVAQKGNLTTLSAIQWKKNTQYKISFYYKTITPTNNSDSNIKLFDKSGTKLFQFNFDLNETTWTKYSAVYDCGIDDAEGSVLFSIRPSTAGIGEVYFDNFLIETIVEEVTIENSIRTKSITSDASIVWQQFGPGMSGNNKVAHWHPTDANMLFIGPNMGNSYYSDDKGFTYHSLYNEDEPTFSTGDRGPREPSSVDFSRQNPDVGFCTDNLKTGIYYTSNRGKNWQKHAASKTALDNIYFSCITVDPKNDNIWYVGGGRMRELGRINFSKDQPHGTYTDANSQQKVFKSINKGATWQLITNGIHANAEVETIKVDPVDSNIIYLNTNYGFYKSTDAGLNWVQKTNGFDHDVMRSFTMHHDKTTNAVTIYVINDVVWKEDGATITDAGGGIFKSTDKGETWIKVNGDVALDMRQFSGNSGIKTSYYNTISFFFGISLDDAKAKFPTMPSKITQRFNTIEVDPTDVNNIYVNNEYSNASENNFKPGQIWRSKNGGTHWYITLRNGLNWNSGSDIQYWTDRGNPVNTNISLKYLSHWVNRDDYDRKGSNFIKFNADGTVLHSQMAKVSLMSYDKGDTWVDIDDEETTPGTESYVGAGNSNVPGHGFFQHKLIPDKVFCAAGENTLWVTNNEGSKVRPGAQAATSYKILDDEQSLSAYVIHPTDINTHYALFFRQSGQGKVYKTTNGGTTWQHIGTPIPDWPESTGGGDQSIHQLSFMIDEENPNNMYFCVPRNSGKIQYVGDSVGEFGVYKSADGGVTWTKANSGLPSSLDVTSICFDPKDFNTLYASVQNTDGGLYKSINKGESWTKVESAAALLSRYGVNDIHFDVDGLAYITTGFSWFDDKEGGLWVSKDNMLTWERIFDHPWVFRVETARYDANTIFISTLGNNNTGYLNPGSYLSKDKGATWIKINKGNGQSDRINDIAIDYHTPGKYYVSTYGSGWYAATDPNPNTVAFSLSPTNYIIKSTDETCIGSANGKIEIETEKTMEYTAVLTGNSINKSENFTDTFTFENLSVGSYSLCIQIKNQPDFTRCFSVEIKQPEALKVASKVTAEGIIEVDLAGSKQYIVDFNGEFQQTDKQQLSLKMKEGNNVLEISTDLECQGLFVENYVNIISKIGVYPNPVEDVMVFNGVDDTFQLKLFSMEGKLILKKDNCSKELNISHLQSGVYLYHISNNQIVENGKLIKK